MTLGLAVALAVAAGCERRAPGAPADLLETGKSLYSQHKEELILRDFFNDRVGGFYVDVGAWHWHEASTTAYLDAHLAWEGIAIDAQSAFAEGWREHRPRAKFFSYIVTDNAGAKEPFFLAHALSTTDAARFGKFDMIDPEKVERVEVETITLDALLDREGVTKIDLLSMDIEGGEPKALAGFDIERFRPELVCIEAGKKFPERNAAVAAYFKEHGYRRLFRYAAYDGLNWYFTPRDPE